MSHVMNGWSHSWKPCVAHAWDTRRRGPCPEARAGSQEARRGRNGRKHASHDATARLACLALAGAAKALPSEVEHALTPYLTLPKSVALKQRTKHLSEALAPLTANEEGLVPFETTNSSSVGGILHTTGFKINLEGAARLDDGATCGCIPVCSLDDVLSSLSRLPQSVYPGCN